MKFSQFAQSIWDLTWTDEYTLPISKIVTYCNIELDTFGLLGSIPGLNETYFSKDFTRDLELSKRKYELPEDLTHISNVAVKIAGTWEDATQYLWVDIQDESKIIELMNGMKPKYRISGNTIKIFSKEAITAVTDGIKMEWTMYPSQFTEDDFTTNDRDMSIPRDASSQGLVRQFHKMFLYRIIIIYKESRDKPIPLNQTEQSYQWQLSDVIETMGLFVYDKRYKMSEPNDDYTTQESDLDPLST